MAIEIENERYILLQEKINSLMGLNFSMTDKVSLLSGFENVYEKIGFLSAEQAITDFLAKTWTKGQIQKLATYLTVNETYFFRHQEHFDVLEKEVIPNILKDSNNIRIWSAASSSGEEAYSLAMLTDKLCSDWQVDILGTDLSPNVIKKAREGIYTNWSFREQANKYKEEYFDELNQNSFKIKDKIKKKVHFVNLNLLTDEFPSINNMTNAMDIIFCRNVLIYFTPKNAEIVLRKLHNCLIPGGYLFLTATESALMPKGLFKTVYFDGGFYYKKNNFGEITKEQSDIVNRINTKEYKPLTEINFRLNKKKEAATVTKAILEKKNKYDPDKEIEIHYTKKNFSKVIELINKKNIKQKKDYILLAKSLANSGELENALETCKNVFKLDKLNVETYYMYGNICQELGKKSEAKETFEKIVFLDFEHILANFALGKIAKEENNAVIAKRHFENTINLLNKLPKDDLVKGSGGISVDRFITIVENIMFN